MTTVFQSMGMAGKVFQLLFWALVFIAALSSSIGMMEAGISAIMDSQLKKGKSPKRWKITFLMAAIALVGNFLTTADCLGECSWMQWFHIFGQPDVLDVWDCIAEGILMPPPLRFDILEEVSRRLPGFPIVLHGASSVPQEYVKEINSIGGKLPDAVGIPEEQLRQAARSAVCKINIDSDIRLAMTGNIRKYFAEHPDHFDPRQYLKPARQAVKDMVAHKIVHVLGSDGKA